MVLFKFVFTWDLSLRLILSIVLDRHDIKCLAWRMVPQIAVVDLFIFVNCTTGNRVQNFVVVNGNSYRVIVAIQLVGLHSCQNCLLPFDGSPFLLTNKFPILEFGFRRKLNNQIFILSNDIVDVFKADLNFSLRDSFRMVERKHGTFWNIPSIPDVCFVENEESLIGEEKCLPFLFQQRVGVLLFP